LTLPHEGGAESSLLHLSPVQCACFKSVGGKP
jgi:hypothetical protein